MYLTFVLQYCMVLDSDSDVDSLDIPQPILTATPPPVDCLTPHFREDPTLATSIVNLDFIGRKVFDALNPPMGNADSSSSGSFESEAYPTHHVMSEWHAPYDLVSSSPCR